MPYGHEYNNSSSGSAGCNYGSLSMYNANYSMGVPPMGKPTFGKYVVPTYSPPTYDTLTGRGRPSCNGYFNITSAYGAGAGQCNQTYTTSLCGSRQ